MTTGLGLGFIKTEVSEDEIEVTVEVKASLMASSPSSSGMVGWLNDCFGCFLIITPEGASTEKIRKKFNYFFCEKIILVIDRSGTRIWVFGRTIR